MTSHTYFDYTVLSRNGSKYDVKNYIDYILIALNVPNNKGKLSSILNSIKAGHINLMSNEGFRNKESLINIHNGYIKILSEMYNICPDLISSKYDKRNKDSFLSESTYVDLSPSSSIVKCLDVFRYVSGSPRSTVYIV